LIKCLHRDTDVCSVDQNAYIEIQMCVA